MERYASMHRKTNETEVTLELCLDGGERSISTGVGFFDHMLSAFAVHGNFGLKVKTVGDWEVDCHHTIEDTGIVLGKAFAEALPTKRGIRRFGHAYIPMDEALAFAAADISGRPYLAFDAAFRPGAAGMTGVRCTVGGMAGGHSGCNIADRRGNAIRLLARLLERSPELLVASFDGGTCDNAIPREAAVCGALPADGVEPFRTRAEAFAREAAGEFDAPPEFRIEVESAPLPERVWTEEFRDRMLDALTGCPDGPTAFDSALGVVRTSSNLAAVRSEGERLVVATSQRSQIDAERAALTEAIAQRFRAAGGAAAVSHAYPGWEPRLDSRLFSTAASLYRELFGKRPEPKVIHAGLECGILSGINPKLEILSFGPTLENPHSPGERLDIASVGRFWRFLRELISRLQSSPRP